ncbi:uridine kinase activity protein [Scheffersomyces xylosifermentans]|uniref:uridine kinase activity protein n=1 Tax=Scheffersomyces xylosifermentans TaxID=1304137 RepID=UPI00315D9738
MAEKQNYEKIVIVAFGGPSSSGKTTSAKAVNALIKNSRLVHLDDFYYPDHDIPIDPTTNLPNWDCPEAINFPRFTQYIKDIRDGKNLDEVIDTMEPDTDLKLSETDEELLLKEIAHNIPNLDKSLLVLVDGFMLFHDPEIIQLFDVRLFFHASYKTLKQRREARKGYNTVEGFWVDPPNYFEDMVWPAYEISHKYLFENNDVNGRLKQSYRNDLRIREIRNETGYHLYTLVKWSLEAIYSQFQECR